jgi:hypothetical protein
MKHTVQMLEHMMCVAKPTGDYILILHHTRFLKVLRY